MQIDPSILEFSFTMFPWILIGLWFVYSFLVISSKSVRDSISNYYVVESIPNVFVTLGLFGTFTGITYGLLNFDTDPNVIKESIKTLLEGLKSALFTSIVGILLSLLFSKRIKYQISVRSVKPPDSDELKELRYLNTNITAFRREISTTHQEAIVKALKGVLENFNDVFMSFINQLVEQNFEKLTEAIDNLTSWQIEYKKDIEQITESYKSLISKHQEFTQNTEKWVKTLEAISGQSGRLKKIVDEFNEAFSEDGNLSIILQEIQSSTEDLGNVTKNFSTLAEKMTDTTSSIKTTEDKIENWTTEISKASNASGQIIDHLATIQDFIIQDLNNLSEEFNKRLATTFASFDNLIMSYIKNIENRIKEK